MKTTIAFLLLCITAPLARAHLTYSGRDFGVLAGDSSGAPATIGGVVSGTYGWAYSTDANLGDSHRLRAFRFTLATDGLVQIDVQATGTGTPLLPAFSIFSGLSHVAPEASAHDGTLLTQQYLTNTYGDPHGKQGAFFALGDWAIGNDDVVVGGILHAASLRYFTYMGNAADGTAVNYGTAPGVNGDGFADGFVSGRFYLPAGDYTIMVGGGMLSDEGVPLVNYGVNVTMSVVPEPAISGLLVAASLLLWRGGVKRRK